MQLAGIPAVLFQIRRVLNNLRCRGPLPHYLEWPLPLHRQRTLPSVAPACPVVLPLNRQLPLAHLGTLTCRSLRVDQFFPSPGLCRFLRRGSLVHWADQEARRAC